MAIQLYKRTNDKFSPEKDSKDPNKQKWNGDSACVKIDGEYVPLSKLAKLANSYVPVQKVENEIEIDGANHDINELIGMYRASKQNSDDNSDKNDPALQAGIKGMKKFSSKKNKDEEDMDEKENEVAGAVEDNEDVVTKKKNEDAGEEELEKGEKKGKEKVVVEKNKNKKMKDNDSDEGFVKDTTKEGKKNEDDVEDKDEEMKDNEVDEDEDVKKKIMQNEKKDVRHFVRLNSARENGSAEGGTPLTIDTMHNRVDRGMSKYGSSSK